ncbi:MAG: YdiU family protein [Deltaproteobacteria bacterium]|nr:YdiU family protein [Deltaproteobacteria bacterium]
MPSARLISLLLAILTLPSPVAAEPLSQAAAGYEHLLGNPLQVNGAQAQRVAGKPLEWGDALLIHRAEIGTVPSVIRGFRMAYRGALQSLLGLPREPEANVGADGALQRFDGGELRWDPQRGIAAQLSRWRPSHPTKPVNALSNSLSADRFGAASGIAMRVPLVALDEREAGIFALNHDALAQHGIRTGRHGHESKALHNKVRRAFAFRAATTDEIARGAFSHVGLATRYSDKLGWVKGDGRALLIGDLVVKDRKNGQVEGIFEVQIKGIATGLRPDGETDNSLHGSGKNPLRDAIGDMMLSEYLHRNGVRTNRTLAILDLNESFEVTHTDPKTKEVHRNKERAALFVRGGSFLRLAHLFQVRHNKKALGALLDHANQRLCREQKRKAPLSYSELYTQLVKRKASELAGTFWARVALGSVTFDNIELFESLDHGTASTVDRMHPRYSYHEKASPGFAKEATFVLENYYLGDLACLMRKATPWKERMALERTLLSARKMVRQTLEHEMTRHALEHLGFDHDQAAQLMAQGSRESHAFWKTVREVGQTAEKNATYRMGLGGEAEVKDPARYDVFNALARLALISESSKLSPIAKEHALARRLRPLHPAEQRDRAAARKLLDAVKGLLDKGLAGLDQKARREGLRLVAQQAREINAPVELQRDFLWHHVQWQLERVKKGEPKARIMAELRAMLRANDRKGFQAPHEVARRVRRGTITMDDGERIRLSRLNEGGVSIDELSNGAEDAIRVNVHHALLGDKPWAARMRYTLDGKSWHEMAPLVTSRGEITFAIPLDKRPALFEARFVDALGKKVDNQGMAFGIGHKLSLSSYRVDAELAIWAARRGLRRQKTPAARRRAAQQRKAR